MFARRNARKRGGGGATASGGPFFDDWGRWRGCGILQQQPSKRCASERADGNRITPSIRQWDDEQSLSDHQARWLFGMRPEQIDVVVQSASTVIPWWSSWDVSYFGSQLGPTDMRMPTICVNLSRGG